MSAALPPCGVRNFLGHLAARSADLLKNEISFLEPATVAQLFPRQQLVSSWTLGPPGFSVVHGALLTALFEQHT
jgi:hypothetical protein